TGQTSTQLASLVPMHGSAITYVNPVLRPEAKKKKATVLVHRGLGRVQEISSSGPLPSAPPRRARRPHGPATGGTADATATTGDTTHGGCHECGWGTHRQRRRARPGVGYGSHRSARVVVGYSGQTRRPKLSCAARRGNSRTSSSSTSSHQARAGRS